MGELLRRNQAEFVRERVMELKSIASSAVFEYRAKRYIDNASQIPQDEPESTCGQSFEDRTTPFMSTENGELKTPLRESVKRSSESVIELPVIVPNRADSLTTHDDLLTSETTRAKMYRLYHDIQPSRWSTLKRRLLDIFSSRNTEKRRLN